MCGEPSLGLELKIFGFTIYKGQGSGARVKVKVPRLRVKDSRLRFQGLGSKFRV